MSGESATIWVTFSMTQPKKSYFLELSPNYTLADVHYFLEDFYGLNHNFSFNATAGITIDYKKTLKECGIKNFSQLNIVIEENNNSPKPALPPRENAHQKNSGSSNENGTQNGNQQDQDANDPPGFAESVKSIINCGYTEIDAKLALRQNHYDPNIALNLLKNGFKPGQSTQTSTTPSFKTGFQFSVPKSVEEGFLESMKSKYEELTDEEKQSIANLVNAGFTRPYAVNAFITCQKNEANALAFLTKQ